MLEIGGNIMIIKVSRFDLVETESLYPAVSQRNP